MPGDSCWIDRPAPPPGGAGRSDWRRRLHTAIDRLYRLAPHGRVWLFGSWGGISYSDNARYLYEHVSDRHPEIEAVWVTRDPGSAPQGARRKWVLYGSRQARTLERRAEAVLYTYEYHDALLRPPRDIVAVQLWHGMPLKKIALDVTSRPRTHGRHDLTIATSDEFARILSGAFGMTPERVVVTGLPRNDVLFRAAEEPSGRTAGRQRTVLYMPTYREGFPLFKKIPAVADLLGHPGLQRTLKAHSARLVVKEHNGHRLWAVPSGMDERERIIPFEALWPRMDIQRVLADAEVLITDYSSCYIDYLLCDRPALFYCHDLERYRTERGFYFDYESVTPGPRTASADELVRHLDDALSGRDGHAADRARLRERFFKHPDGGSCERVFAAVRDAVEARR